MVREWQENQRERTEAWGMRDWREGGKAWINKQGARVRLRGA